MKNSNTKYLVRAGLIASILLFVTLPDNHAQDISFTAKAPKVLHAEEQFQLVYSVNKKIDEFTPPNFGEFRYLGGPSTGSSTSISNVNGKMTKTSSYTFTYYLQAPSSSGKYTLAPATATFKKNEIESNPLEIDVVATGQSSSQQLNSGSKAVTNSAESSGGDELFVRLVTDKKTAYIGEQITAWVKLYNKLNFSGYDQRFKGPDFVGFYQQEVELPSRSFERERVGNDIYDVGVLKKIILYPQKSGEIIVEPFELIVEVQKQTRRQSQNIFDEFFGPQYVRSRINLKSKPVKFTIRQLPLNQPDDFTGAVGKFKIQASANESRVTTNDAISFKVVVSGKGNLKLLENVKTNFPPTFDIFEPIRKVQIDNSSEGKTGKVSFEYTAIPRHAGNFEIPAFSLSYFDPSLKAYQNIKSQDFSIIVDKGDDDSTTVVASNLSKEDIELLGSDIRYILTKTNLQKRGYFIFGTKWFYGVYIFTLALLIFVLIIRKEQIKRTANIVKYRNRKAGKVAGRRLKKARKLLKNNNKEEFYEEIGRALWGYLSDKLNIQLSELSKEKTGEELKNKKIDEGQVTNFFSLVDACEYARFAPGSMDTDLQEFYSKASKIISELDQNL
ncbi:hypothetical protein ES708_09893 [subsurface metagenome]